jgi:23S rRNA (guanosine2251-2'-O)-methyltransferase
MRTIRGGIFDTLENKQVNAQGVALEVDEYPYVEFDEILARPGHKQTARGAGASLLPLILILDHIQDPQNLGSLFRTAEAMAVDGVLIPDRRAAGITPAAVNASAGAVEHLRVARVTNLNRAIDELKEANFWIAGLEDEEAASTPDSKLLNGALAVVVGSEGAGISRLTRDKCDFTVRLPMYGRVESLNAAVAGSILLYLIRQAQNNNP